MKYSEIQKEPIIFEGKESGKTVIILGGIHGDEICGIESINFLRNNPPDIKRGKLILMYGNLKAIESGTRQHDVNLNRIFLNGDKYLPDHHKTYEYVRANEIKSYLNEADVLLDIHSVRSQDGTPFIICENNSKEIIKYFPFLISCSGFDEAHPGGTDGYMNGLNKQGICIECGTHTDPKAFERAINSINIFLRVTDLIDGKEELVINDKQKSFNCYFIYKTKNNFILSDEFIDFTPLKKGTLIGIDGNEKIYTDKDSIIVFAQNRDSSNQEAFCLLEEV
jgi:succinylglutamate desuccinylase